MSPPPQGKDQPPVLASPRTSPLARRPMPAISRKSLRQLFRNNRQARHTPEHIGDLSVSLPQNIQSLFQIPRPTSCSSNSGPSNNPRKPPGSPTAFAPIALCLPSKG